MSQQEMLIIPDYGEFARSLDLAQVGFLVKALHGSSNRKYFPLRHALQERLFKETDAGQTGVGDEMMTRFFRVVPPPQLAANDPDLAVFDAVNGGNHAKRKKGQRLKP